MSALNTLRTKGGVILVVVIGICLLAFILGDLTTTGGTLRNASKMNVGTIDGQKVSARYYEARVEHLTNIQKIATGRESLSDKQLEEIKNQAWEQIIVEKSVNPGLQALGLTVSAEEEKDMAIGTYISPVIASVFTNSETGIFDANMVHNFTANMDKDPNGRARYFWNHLVTEMNSERLMSKYLALVEKGVYTTSLEAEQGVENSNNRYTAQVVSVPYTQVPDSTVHVTAKDLRAYYEENKHSFRQTDARDIEYVIFDAVPSQKDYEEASKYINQLAEEFRASSNVQQFASLNSQVPLDTRFYKESELPAELGKFAFSASKEDLYGPVFENGRYTMARIIDIKAIPDTIGAMHILLPEDMQQKADSLMNLIKKGADFEDLARRYSIDQSAARNGGDLGRFDPNDMIPAFTEAAIHAKTGEVYTVKSPYGIHVVKIYYMTAPQRKVQLAVVGYKVEPSNQTQQMTYAQASRFHSEVKGDYDNFNRIVRDSAFSKRVVRLKSGERNVPGIDQSTELVRWAFGAGVGDVSPVITVGEKNIVAIMTSVREAGIVPFEQIKSEITPIVMARKKGEILSKLMAGKTLDQISKERNTDVAISSGINFNTFYAPEIGVEPEVIGAATGVKLHTVSKPVAGYSGVFVLMVTDVENTNESDLATEKAMLQSNAEADIQARTYGAIFEMSNIRDMRVMFF